jgi:hypothetical protein
MSSCRGCKLGLGRIRATCWYNVCCMIFVSAFLLFHSLFLCSFLCGNIRKSWPPPHLCPAAHDVDNIRFSLIPLPKRFINTLCLNVNWLVVASCELCAEMQWCTGCCGVLRTVRWDSVMYWLLWDAAGPPSAELCTEMQWRTDCCGMLQGHRQLNCALRCSDVLAVVGLCWATVSWQSDLTMKQIVSFSCIEIWLRPLRGLFLPSFGRFS